MSTKKNNSNKDSYFMQLALNQAQIPLGNTGKNPSVGCVIVKKGFIIGAGSTSKLGRPHAESNAINFVEKNIKNSTLYSTLEPCSNHGQTPPCVNKIIKNKIKNVYFSIKDPDPKSFGKSLLKFKKNKINVNQGICSTKINYFYTSYKNSRKGLLPFVTAKIAASRDLYTVNKKKEWITNKFSRGRVHLMRSTHDCILTSVRTVIADDPNLTCRIKGIENRSPVRIILDKNLNIPPRSRIVRSAKKYFTIIFFNKGQEKKIKYLNKLKVKLIRFPLAINNNFDLHKLLIKITQLGFSRIFLESGINLVNSFLDKNLVNDLYLFLSDKKLGIYGRNKIEKKMKFLFKNKKTKNIKVNLFNDRLISYKIN